MTSIPVWVQVITCVILMVGIGVTMISGWGEYVNECDQKHGANNWTSEITGYTKYFATQIYECRPRVIVSSI